MITQGVLVAENFFTDRTDHILMLVHMLVSDVPVLRRSWTEYLATFITREYLPWQQMIRPLVSRWRCASWKENTKVLASRLFCQRLKYVNNITNAVFCGNYSCACWGHFWSCTVCCKSRSKTPCPGSHGYPLCELWERLFLNTVFRSMGMRDLRNLQGIHEKRSVSQICGNCDCLIPRWLQGDYTEFS